MIFVIAELTPAALQRDLSALLDPQARAVWALYASNIVRSVEMMADRPGAVMTLECGSIEEAQRAVDSLPLIRDGLAEARLAPLKNYTNWGYLFTPAADQPGSV